jgi:hypothetical protein
MTSSFSQAQLFQKLRPSGLSPIATDWSAVGCYFKGETYIFYPYTTLNPITNLIEGNKIYYTKVSVNVNDSLEFVQDANDSFPFDVKNTSVIPAACVFNGRLYFFYTKANGRIMYTSTNGESWTDPEFVGDFDAVGFNLSASVLGNKLYLAKQNSNKHIGMIYTKDFESWKLAGRILSASDVEKKKVYISSATFTTSDNKSHLLISVNPKNSWIFTTWYDKNNGYHNSQTVPNGALAKSAHLVQGSFNFLNGSDSNADIQMLIRGTDDKLWYVQYYPDSDYWSDPVNTNFFSGMSYTPGVFTLFRKGKYNNNILKRICFAEARISGLTYAMNVCVVKSDKIKITDQTSNNCSNLPELWSLVGVVEGPPPFVLNGRTINELNGNDTPPSVFVYGTSESSEVVNSTEWTVSTSVSVSAPFADIFSAGLDVKAAVSDLTSTSYSNTYSVSRSVVPGEYKLGYYYFLVPTITRYKYERFNFDNVTTNQYEYVFAVTDASLMTVDYQLKDVDPFDITSYKDRSPDPAYKRIAEKGFSWRTGSPSESLLTFETSTENTGSASVSVEANFGAADIFDISAGYSIEFKETHRTSFGESVGINLQNPAPRSGYSEDVKAYNGIAYWLKSKSKNDYWIPKDLNDCDYSDQRPWLVTWSIDSIEYNDLTDIGGEDELPVEFDLSQNYPNPFNPVTTIKYSIPSIKNSISRGAESSAHVEIIVLDMLGRKVATLINEKKQPGIYSIDFDAEYLPSGMYLYQIRAGNFSDIKKMMLLK